MEANKTSTVGLSNNHIQQLCSTPAQAISTQPGTATGAPPNAAVSPTPNIQQSSSKTDDEVIREIMASSQGARFDNLMQGNKIPYRDDRMAIMALLGIIAGFTQDIIQMDRIFRRSPLVPPWWDKQVTIKC